MKCQKCNYIFSEEKKICPRCGSDMGMVFEKLGYFPPSTSKPFLTIEDFQEKSSFTPERKEEIVLEEE